MNEEKFSAPFKAVEHETIRQWRVKKKGKIPPFLVCFLYSDYSLHAIYTIRNLVWSNMSFYLCGTEIFSYLWFPRLFYFIFGIFHYIRIIIRWPPELGQPNDLHCGPSLDRMNSNSNIIIIPIAYHIYSFFVHINIYIYRPWVLAKTKQVEIKVTGEAKNDRFKIKIKKSIEKNKNQQKKY